MHAMKQTPIMLLVVLMVGCAGLIGPDVKPGIALFEEGKYKESLDHYETIIAEGKANAKVLSKTPSIGTEKSKGNKSSKVSSGASKALNSNK